MPGGHEKNSHRMGLVYNVQRRTVFRYIAQLTFIRICISYEERVELSKKSVRTVTQTITDSP